MAQRERVQLAYNAYNRDLVARVKAADDWVTLLRILTPELSSTQYNITSSARWLNPNKKCTQLTVQSVQAALLRLIKTRGTRRRALGDDALMATLHRFVVLLETMAPRLHEHAQVWRFLYHPYLYLRKVVELWREEKEERWRAQQREAESQKEEQRSAERGILTDRRLRQKVQEARERRRASGALAPAEDDAAEDSNRGGGLSVDEEEREDERMMTPDERMRAQLTALLEEEQRRRERILRPDANADEERPPPAPSPALSAKLRSKTTKVPSYFSASTAS